uniref:Uncharacterized protein n=1 Tax=Spermophilus dauricus TaxID=99837 RepID=A0A8C9P544_SPEDA
KSKTKTDWGYLGLPERVPWEGLAPWPRLGQSPVMLHDPQKEPAVPQSWRSFVVADCRRSRKPRSLRTYRNCTAWDLQLHTSQDAGRFRWVHCMRLEALTGVHGRSLLGDSGGSFTLFSSPSQTMGPKMKGLGDVSIEEILRRVCHLRPQILILEPTVAGYYPTCFLCLLMDVKCPNTAL